MNGAWLGVRFFWAWFEERGRYYSVRNLATLCLWRSRPGSGFSLCLNILQHFLVSICALKHVSEKQYDVEAEVGNITFWITEMQVNAACVSWVYLLVGTRGVAMRIELVKTCSLFIDVKPRPRYSFELLYMKRNGEHCFHVSAYFTGRGRD